MFGTKAFAHSQLLRNICLILHLFCTRKDSLMEAIWCSMELFGRYSMLLEVSGMLWCYDGLLLEAIMLWIGLFWKLFWKWLFWKCLCQEAVTILHMLYSILSFMFTRNAFVIDLLFGLTALFHREDVLALVQLQSPFATCCWEKWVS